MKVSVLLLFLTMPFVIVVFPDLTHLVLSAVVGVVFPVYTHLLFAYLVSIYLNECFIHSTILN